MHQTKLTIEDLHHTTKEGICPKEHIAKTSHKSDVPKTANKEDKTKSPTSNSYGPPVAIHLVK